MSTAENITSPVGRVVAGSLYDPQTKDGDGNLRVIKKGPNAGQPNPSYFFAIAVAKNPGETHWAQTEWGQKIWAVGHAVFPQAAQSPSFAWKVEDGDSQIPNTKGKRPCENEGWAGHWIIKLTSGFAPRICQEKGNTHVPLDTLNFIKPGYFVQVSFSVKSNDSQQKPGVYLNHSMVCFRAFGEEISFGPDFASAGFGAAPLPPGASMTPPASSMPLPVPGAALPPPAAAPAVPVASIAPRPEFAAMAAPAPAPARQMTAAANGLTYEQYIAAGWNDQQLIAGGLMTA